MVNIKRFPKHFGEYISFAEHTAKSALSCPTPFKSFKHVPEYSLR